MRTVEVVVINLDPDGELKSLAISHRLDSLLIVLALGYFAIILMYALEFDIRFLPLYGPGICVLSLPFITWRIELDDTCSQVSKTFTSLLRHFKKL